MTEMKHVKSPVNDLFKIMESVFGGDLIQGLQVPSYMLGLDHHVCDNECMNCTCAAHDEAYDGVGKDFTPPEPNPYDGIKFSYIGERGNMKDHGGVITIASRLEDGSNIVWFGVSYCSPEDTYDKHVGKKIAFERLERYHDCADYKSKNSHEIMVRILSALQAECDVPSWAEAGVAYDLMWHMTQAFKLEVDVREV